MSKKGVSALIETVLIIGFTIVLAVLVMTWGTDFFKKMTINTGQQVETATGCTSMSFAFGDVFNTTVNNENIVSFSVTADQKGIGSFVVLLDHGTAGTDSLSSTGKDFGDAKNSVCNVNPYATTVCKISAGIFEDTNNPNKLVTGDKIKLIPMIALEDETLNGCPISSASSKLIQTNK